MIRVSAVNGYGSTATKIRRFSNILSSIGSDVLYQDSATAGASFTIQTAGIYSISYVDSFSGASQLGITLNQASLTTNVSDLLAPEVLSTHTTGGASFEGACSWQGYLPVGSIIRACANAAGTGDSAITSFTISRTGSTKVLNTTSDQKIEIPTSELRFEGSSSRGAVATAIVKFDTLAKIRGDAFTVTNTTNDGTFVTMTKAGILNISATLLMPTNTNFFISKNQAILTTEPVASEIIGLMTTNASTGSFGASASCQLKVEVGDIFRVSSAASLSAYKGNTLNLSFQEQRISVSVSNTLPQFSESDSSVRVDTANGYGSTGTKIRRFSNVRDNIGTDIEYADSATNGASFRVVTAGTYNISYTDNFSAQGLLGISKNASSLTTSSQSLPTNETLAIASTIGANQPASASWEGYLNVGDIIRPQTEGQAVGATSSAVKFTISKVGKPNVTGVDVTPFINVPQPDSQSNTLFSAATISTTTNLSTISTSSTGNGLYTLTTSGITALKAIKLNVSISGQAVSSGNNGLCDTVIRRNGTIVAFDRGIYSTATAALGAGTSANLFLQPGEVVTLDVSYATTTSPNSYATILAEALSDQILTPIESFSTDTALLQYAPSSSYTLATLSNAPVGTFITFTYAANTNTRTQTTTRPTQTDADMNANGLQIFTRAYNAASTAASPAAVAIQIGKGLKGTALNLYKSVGKATAGTLDNIPDTLSSITGITFRDYNEATGVLFLDAAFSYSSAVTTRVFLFSDATAQSSGYLVINASKNPAITGFGLNRVAARGVSTSGQSIPSNTLTVVTYDAVKTIDTHNALNAATGVFTAPEAGYYQVDARAMFDATGVYAIGNQIRVDINKNGVGYSFIHVEQTQSTSQHLKGGGGADILFLAKGDTLDMRVFNNRSSATSLWATTGATYFSISKISV
jgi:hypothetical protein